MAGSVEGLSELVTFFRAASRVGPEIRKSVYRGAKNVGREAQANASRHAKRAGHPKVTPDTGGGDISADIETTSGFGAIDEFGTPSWPGGHPTMLPALDVEREELPKQVEDIIDRWLQS